MVVLRPVFKQAESTQESVDNKLHEVAEILQQLQCQPAVPAAFISTSCLISKWQTCETVGHWFLHSVQVHLSCMFYWLTRVYLVSTHLAEHHLCTALANLAVEVPMFLRPSSSSFLACNSRLHIRHRDQLWSISIASGNVTLWDLSCVMRGVLEVSSSPLEGQLTGSSWHLCCRPYTQCAQKVSGNMTRQLQWVCVVPLASRPCRS